MLKSGSQIQLGPRVAGEYENMAGYDIQCNPSYHQARPQARIRDNSAKPAKPGHQTGKRQINIICISIKRETWDLFIFCWSSSRCFRSKDAVCCSWSASEAISSVSSGRSIGESLGKMSPRQTPALHSTQQPWMDSW